jgi:hypothetical protein
MRKTINYTFIVIVNTLRVTESKRKPNHQESIMVLFILVFCLFVLLIAIGAVNLQPWKSGRHMINAEWLDDSEKFELIARWGVKG